MHPVRPKTCAEWVMPRVVLISLLHGFLLAQSPPAAFDPLSDSALIEKGLQSTMPLQVAISAFRSVKITHQQRGGWLREALTRSLSLQPEPEAVRARRAIFDALIRTGTPVPLTQLLPFFDQFPAAVIAIVAKNNSSQDEDRLPLLLKAEETKNSLYWYAAASLLNRKQLIQHLVHQARLDYAISVIDQDFVPVQVFERPPSGIIMSGIPGGVIGGITTGSQVAWPEETAYHIEKSGDTDHVLTCCIGGSTYLKAWPASTHAFGDPQPADLAWEDHDREVVRALLSIAHCAVCQFDRGDFPNVRGGKASIVWHSLEQARSLLEEAVEQYVKECVKMIGALGESTLSEYETRSKVRIWIRDQRRIQTIPIPSVGAGVEFNRCASIQNVTTNGRCID
jgi:hypothetical protein